MTHLPEGTSELITRALAEDIGSGDVTANATVPESLTAQAHIVLKQPGVIFGLDVVEEVFRQTGASDLDRTVVEGHWHDSVPRDVMLVNGPARAILAGERVALNFLGHLSGIATLTARYVDAVGGTGARILDTRKTLPGLRALEKQAVSWGGGMNHRFGLYDAVLIKENHIALAGGVREAVEACRRQSPGLHVEVEAETLDQVAEGIEAGADRILLDNMDVEHLKRAVDLRESGGPGTELEASGGMNLLNVREVAETGVDFISIGALTHSAPQLDVSLLLDPAP
ncbi:MAG: carboxylating nicotinate-nucleotide diphosphorylase [Solirubrobacterales bacterium]|nr:carboxylating nicotinate-nucleotide diphosphorylase [Solirubrobacterales bacterium]OJU95501.1 MAG: nicotinate-nucleotide diphosphorylase (carboxylating) [Solirubrobacterales bacterium 67-14]